MSYGMQDLPASPPQPANIAGYAGCPSAPLTGAQDFAPAHPSAAGSDLFESPRRHPVAASRPGQSANLKTKLININKIKKLTGWQD